MGALYHNGHFYGSFDAPIQSNPQATSLNAGEVPTGDTIESVLNTKIHIYENLSFVFNNSQTAQLAITDIDSNLVHAKAIIAFQTNAGTPYLATRSSNNASIGLYCPVAPITGTPNINLIAFY